VQTLNLKTSCTAQTHDTARPMSVPLVEPNLSGFLRNIHKFAIPLNCQVANTAHEEVLKHYASL